MGLPNPAILKPEPLWTGKQIISLLLPEECSIRSICKQDHCFLSDRGVMIKKGELLTGSLHK